MCISFFLLVKGIYKCQPGNNLTWQRVAPRRNIGRQQRNIAATNKFDRQRLDRAGGWKFRVQPNSLRNECMCVCASVCVFDSCSLVHYNHTLVISETGRHTTRSPDWPTGSTTGYNGMACFLNEWNEETMDAKRGRLTLSTILWFWMSPMLCWL